MSRDISGIVIRYVVWSMKEVTEGDYLKQGLKIHYKKETMDGNRLLDAESENPL